MIKRLTLHSKNRPRKRNLAPVAISTDVRAAMHDDGLVILDTRKGLVFTSNRTGSQIWQGITSGQSLEAVAEGLSLEYGVARSEVEKHADEFLCDLIYHGIVRPVRGSAECD